MDAAKVPTVVDVLSGRVRNFVAASEITIGRHPTNSIDIPDRIISRLQCVLKLNDNNQWIITDKSSQKSTLLNGIQLQGGSKEIKSGDKISFFYSSADFIFYECSTEVSNLKKRKQTESEPVLTKTPCKVLRTCKEADVTSIVQEPEVEKKENDVLTPEDLIIDLSPSVDFQEMYEKAMESLEKLKAANYKEAADLSSELIKKEEDISKLKKDLQSREQEKKIIEKEKEILLYKLSDHEVAKEKMLMEIQDLTECLKDCEEEKDRLADEYRQPISCITSGPSTSKQDDAEQSGGDCLSSSAINSIVDLVEAQWNETEIKHLRSELSEKNDKITDLTLEQERNRQSFAEVIDNELLCSICSEILCNAVTLNCRHTFCQACVAEWKDKKKVCPVCRARIKSEVQPLVLDSFIDRLCEVFGGELKTRRDEVKAERKSADGKYRINRRRTTTTPRRRRNFHPVTVDLRFPPFPSSSVVGLRGLPQIFPIIDLTGTSPQARRSSRLHINNNNVVL